jgi:hypothetical protein
MTVFALSWLGSLGVLVGVTVVVVVLATVLGVGGTARDRQIERGALERKPPRPSGRDGDLL